MFFILALLFNVLLGECTPIPIVSLRDSFEEGGIMKSVDFAYQTGFNAVFVPLQKTRDSYARFVVSTDPKISESSLLEYHQQSSSYKGYATLLGEFLGGTSSTIQTLFIPIYSHDDVDRIVHEISISPRSNTDFVMVLPDELAELKPDKSDAISRFRSLVPGGKIVLYDDEYQEHETALLLHLAKSLGIDQIAVPADLITSDLVDTAHLNYINVGTFYADTEEKIRKAIDLDVDFFTTQEPLQYLTLTSKKTTKTVNKSHSAVLFA